MTEIKGKNEKGETTYTYSYTGEEAKKMIGTIFGEEKKAKNSFVRKIQDFEENHFFIALILFLTLIFLVLYFVSVASWNGGKCLLIVPYFSHPTDSSCAGLDNAFTNAIYLFLVIIIVSIASAFLRRK